jgi:hypothetical protein
MSIESSVTFQDATSWLFAEYMSHIALQGRTGHLAIETIQTNVVTDISLTRRLFPTYFNFSYTVTVLPPPTSMDV